MSNSRKKNYKKRKPSAHVKAKTHVNVREETPLQKFLNEWLWLVTLIVIAILVALLVICIPMCNEGGACYGCVQACEECGEKDDTANAPVNFSEQLSQPKEGEEIAVFETTAGTFRVRLFPNNAPETVANFKGLVSSGYYDGITFHRVINGFMVQTGDPTATGTGGKTYSGQPLVDEYDNGLYHFRYALSMANSGTPNSGSSQFFVVQSNTVFAGMDETGTIASTYSPSELMSIGYEEGVAQYYNMFGGTPLLDYEIKSLMNQPAHTVFGQVFDGVNVIDAIAAVATDENDKPLEDVVIIRAYLDTYHVEAPATSTDAPASGSDTVSGANAA